MILHIILKWAQIHKNLGLKIFAIIFIILFNQNAKKTINKTISISLYRKIQHEI